MRLTGDGTDEGDSSSSDEEIPAQPPPTCKPPVGKGTAPAKGLAQQTIATMFSANKKAKLTHSTDDDANIEESSLMFS